MISFTGNHAQLDKWISQLKGVDGALSDLSAALAEEAISQVALGFRRQGDPYGKGWAPKKRGGGRILHGPTGALRNSFHKVDSSASGFTIASGVNYSRFHQDGTKTKQNKIKMVARMMLPRDNDIPGKWEKAFDEVAEEILDEHLGG